MSKNLKFSIVTPSFNQAHTITQTIESVLSQAYPFVEYFIYDNLSTDGTNLIIKKYPKIKSQIQHDQGQPDALNQAFERASGDIFAFINSDDYYLPGIFKKVAQYFNDHPECQWLVGNCNTYPISFSWTFRLKEIMPYDKFPKLLHIFNFVNQPAVFIRKDIFRQVGNFNSNLHYCFDYDFWLRLISLSTPHRLHEPLAVFRITSSAKGSIGFKKQFQEDYQVILKYNKNIILLLLHKVITMLVISIYSFLK